MPVLKQIKNSTASSLANNKNSKRFGCVIMASGLGKRFGGNKLMAELGTKPMLQWILDTTKDLFDYRVVVTRNADVQQLCIENNIDVIMHEFPGRNDTVRLGLTGMKELVDYCFFTPADQPFIKRESLIGMMHEALREDKKIVRTVFDERVGAPICFPEWTFEELLNLPEGKGGGAVVKKYPDNVSLVCVASEAELDDIDTVGDYELAKLISARLE